MNKNNLYFFAILFISFSQANFAQAGKEEDEAKARLYTSQKNVAQNTLNAAREFYAKFKKSHSKAFPFAIVKEKLTNLLKLERFTFNQAEAAQKQADINLAKAILAHITQDDAVDLSTPTNDAHYELIRRYTATTNTVLSHIATFVNAYSDIVEYLPLLENAFERYSKYGSAQQNLEKLTELFNTQNALDSLLIDSFKHKGTILGAAYRAEFLKQVKLVLDPTKTEGVATRIRTAAETIKTRADSLASVVIPTAKPQGFRIQLDHWTSSDVSASDSSSSDSSNSDTDMPEVKSPEQKQLSTGSMAGYLAQALNMLTHFASSSPTPLMLGFNRKVDLDAEAAAKFREKFYDDGEDAAAMRKLLQSGGYESITEKASARRDALGTMQDTFSEPAFLGQAQ